MRRRIAPDDGQRTAAPKPTSTPPPPVVERDAKPEKPETQLRLPEVPASAEKLGDLPEERRPPPPVPEGELEMGMGTARIVRSVFDLPDVWTEYQELRASLKSEQRASAMSSGRLLDELDGAGDRSQRGAELLAVVKAAHDDFEMLANISTAGMHDRAVEALLADNDERKAEKKAVKRVNKDDVAATIATMFPDEWADLSQKRSRSKRAVAVVESLADRLQERQRDLRAMVQAKRGD